jgi:hypothetical protein
MLAIITVILTACTSTVTITCAGPSHDDWQDCDAKATKACRHEVSLRLVLATHGEC